MASGLDGLEGDNLAADGRQDHVLGVGQLSQSLILPVDLADGAEPVLDVTQIVATGSNRLHMNDVVLGNADHYVLGVGQLSQGLILPILLTIGAIPVLDVTLLVAGGILSLHVLQILAAGGGQDHVLGVGQLSQGLILPVLLALGAEPVSDLAVVVASGLDGLESDHFAALSGDDDVLGVGQLSQSLVSPEALALGAEPVLDVTVVVATGLHRVKVDDALGVDGTDLAAQVTIGIAGSVILVLATNGRITLNSDSTVGSLENNGLGTLVRTVEESGGIVVHNQRIGAGSGIVLDLEGSGSQQLAGVILGLGGAVAEVHDAVAQVTPGEPLLGVALAGND